MDEEPLMTVEEFRRMHLRRQKTKQVREVKCIASYTEAGVRGSSSGTFEA